MATHKPPTVVRKSDINHDDINVVIVEDELDLANAYKANLKGRCSVSIAKTKREAIKQIGENTDIVLLDRNLPKASGEEILIELRDDPEFNAQVAMLTAVRPDEDIVDIPVDDYKTKQISRTELHKLVDSLLLREAFEDISKKFFRLNSKRAALQESDSANGETYQKLTEEIDECQESLESIIRKINNNSIFRTFPA
jgi:DNA-binding response OmpR family regulator